MSADVTRVTPVLALMALLAIGFTVAFAVTSAPSRDPGDSLGTSASAARVAAPGDAAPRLSPVATLPRLTIASRRHAARRAPRRPTAPAPATTPLATATPAAPTPTPTIAPTVPPAPTAAAPRAPARTPAPTPSEPDFDSSGGFDSSG
jgi:hypothetical protein